MPDIDIHASTAERQQEVISRSHTAGPQLGHCPEMQPDKSVSLSEPQLFHLPNDHENEMRTES